MWTDLAGVALAGWLGLALIMAGAFALGRRLDNFGIVDAAWAWQFTPLTVWYVIAFEGGALRQGVLLGMVALWSLRLGTHLARRIAHHHPEEDRRYAELRVLWRGALDRRMFGFFQLQGLFTLVLSLPLFLAAANPAEGWSIWETAGAILFAVALAGEALADRQLQQFKKANSNRKAICRVGLWRYSRHPNYFFEWLIWVSFSLFAFGSPLGWTGVLSPLIMLWLLVKVTGIPPTEAQAVKSKGDAYRAYQRSTSAFFPWFSRS
jgi:steroid 5-alpha reductase family enzyme